MNERSGGPISDTDRAAVKILEIPGGDTTRRPVHTIGVGASGHFQASDVARHYCTAAFFQEQIIRVTIRFSNGSGLASCHDGRNDVRGMAVRFHLDDAVDDGGAADLLAMTLPEFFTPDVKTFMAFAEATKPAPVRRQSAWSKLLGMLCLVPPSPDPPPGVTMSPDPGAVAFAGMHAYARLPLLHGVNLGAPVSYARASYHAVHTFIVVAPDGTRRPVRFNWVPVAGVRNTDPDAPPRDYYLHEELRDRLAVEPARFILMMCVGEVGDDLNDPARSWPPHRVRIIMGTLTVTAVAKDQVESGERLSFNPWRLVPGIEPSEDPILSLRRGAYEFSRERRGGIACPFSGG